MGAAAAQTWARLRKASGCSSSSSWAKQIAYLTASSRGRFLLCCTHFGHFSVSWSFLCPGRQKCVSRDTVVTAVQNFLYTCQPFFNHLEHLTRSIVSQSNPLPAESCTRVNFHSFIAFFSSCIWKVWKVTMLRLQAKRNFKHHKHCWSCRVFFFTPHLPLDDKHLHLEKIFVYLLIKLIWKSQIKEIM